MEVETMLHMTVCTTVDRTIETVWEQLADIESHVYWMGDAESIAFTSTQRTGVGTAFDCLTKLGPFRTVDRMTITEWEPGRAMEVVHKGLVTGVGRFELTRLDARSTQFCWVERLQFPKYFGGRVGEVVARPAMLFVWRRSMRRFRNLVEDEVAAGTE
jgi:hypothetical protein